LAGLVLLTVLAAALRFWRLRHQGFWFDEANTSQELRFTPGQMITLLKHYESTPPFYYAVAWVWGRIFGFGEAGLRSLSAICGVLVVPLAYALGHKLFSKRTGLIVAAFVACNPLLIWYSQEARAYEMLVLLTAVALLAFAYARERPERPALTVWAAASVLAMATEYYAALVVIPMAVWFLYEHRQRREVLGSIAAVAVLSLPLLWFAISQNATGHASWIKHVSLGPRVGQIFPQFLVGFGAPGGIALSWIAAVLTLTGLGLIAVRRDLVAVRMLGALLLGAIVINALLVAVGVDNLLTRNVLPMWLPAAVLVAAGLGLRRTLLPGVALTAVLCGVGIAAAVGVEVNRTYQRPDWRQVASVLGTRPAQGVAERAILIQNYRDVLPLSLYMPHLHAWHHTGTDKVSHYTRTYPVLEVDVVSISSPPAPSTGCWWGSACNLISSQLQSTYPIAGFRPVSIRRSHQFTILRMVANRPVMLTPPMVSSALTNTKLIYDDLLVQTAS